MSFAERLVETRESLGMTQRELAIKLGITPTRLNYWEKGKREPDMLYIKALAEALGVTADWLICAENAKKYIVASKEAMLVAYKYDALDLPGQSLVRLVVDHETERVQSASHAASEAALLQHVQAGAQEAAQPEGRAAGDQP